MLSLEARRGRVELRLTATLMGRDLCVTLSGGDLPHIGAVALSQPSPSPGDSAQATSVITLEGHREDELARALASRLAESLQATVCVACGIHVDGIRKDELQAVAAITEELALEVIRGFSGSPGAWSDIPLH